VSEPADASGVVGRFDRVERAVHWVNALLFVTLILTGAILYIQPLMALIGRRRLIEDIHVYAGLALPIPVIVALAGSWGRALRADLSRLNRWTADDGAWLRLTTSERAARRRARERLVMGKFNAGQKLNAAFVAGAGLVMLGTGAILRWYRPFPLDWRAGATFVHNWLALALFVVIVGHIGMALSDRDALGSMLTGRVDRRWALRHAPGWIVELDAARLSRRGDAPRRVE